MSLISRVCLRGSTAKRLAHHWVFSVWRGSAKASSKAIFPFMVACALAGCMMLFCWERERKLGGGCVVVIYKILQWADKFCEGTIYRCEWNKFSSKSTPQRLPFVCRERKGGEKKRGEVGKCTF